MPKVFSKAPTRVDLAGGTLDIRPLSYVLDHKATVNIGISLFAEIELENQNEGFTLTSLDQRQSFTGSFDELYDSREMPLFRELLLSIWRPEWQGLKIVSQAGSPAGAGLGGSSCLAVSLAASLFRMRRLLYNLAEPNEVDLVRFVQDVEARLIHCPTGCQDYWGAVRGGMNLIDFPPGDPNVETLREAKLGWISERMILCFSGKSRASGQNNWEIFKQVFDRDQDLIDQLNEIGRLSIGLAKAVRSANWRKALEYSAQEWAVRRKLWPAIETEETKRIDQASREAGASLSRVCGAGGGGVMVLFAEPEHRSAVCQAATQAGGQILEAVPTHMGLMLHEVD